VKPYWVVEDDQLSYEVWSAEGMLGKILPWWRPGAMSFFTKDALDSSMDNRQPLVVRGYTWVIRL
jgi:hypothetical protein